MALSATATWYESWILEDPSTTSQPSPFVHSASGKFVRVELTKTLPPQVVADTPIECAAEVRVEKPANPEWDKLKVTMRVYNDTDIREEIRLGSVDDGEERSDGYVYFSFEDIKFLRTEAGWVITVFVVTVGYKDGDGDAVPPQDLWPKEEKPDELVAGGRYLVGELVLNEVTLVDAGSGR